MRWRHLLQQIGGRSAISIWSWLITLPLAIVISSTYRPGVSFADVLIWVGIVVVVHGALGIVMWIALKTILPNTDRRSRPLTALAFFGLLGLARAIAMQAVQNSIGISGGVLSERVAVNIVGSIVALSIIAIIVDDFRTDERIVRRLEQARTALLRMRDGEEEALRAADFEVLAQVKARVESELRAAGENATRIRGIADEIVRPISHALAQSSGDDLLPRGQMDNGRARLTFSGAFGRMNAPSPAAVVVLVEGTILGAVAVRFGPVVALTNLVIGGGLIFLGCWILARVLPLPRRPLARLIVLGVSLGAIGVIATAITARVITALLATFTAVLIGVAGGVAGAGLALSLWAAVNAGRLARQEVLSQAVAEEAAEIERLRGLINERRLQAARFLHGPIQGELVAAALRHDSPEEIRVNLEQRFAEYGRADRRGAKQQVQDVVDAWSTVLDIGLAADPACWRTLDGHPERLRLLVDALSEGLTNVVRHASGSTVKARITSVESGICLVIESEGTLRSVGEVGLGLAQLEVRGARISLEGAGERTMFVSSM